MIDRDPGGPPTFSRRRFLVGGTAAAACLAGLGCGTGGESTTADDSPKRPREAEPEPQDLNEMIGLKAKEVERDIQEAMERKDLSGTVTTTNGRRTTTFSLITNGDRTLTAALEVLPEGELVGIHVVRDEELSFELVREVTPAGELGDWWFDVSRDGELEASFGVNPDTPDAQQMEQFSRSFTPYWVGLRADLNAASPA